jgi:hypothetical protein
MCQKHLPAEKLRINEKLRLHRKYNYKIIKTSIIIIM